MQHDDPFNPSTYSRGPSVNKIPHNDWIENSPNYRESVVGLNTSNKVARVTMAQVEARRPTMTITMDLTA